MAFDSSATASASGYFFQARFALYTLLASIHEDAELYVEALDDVDLRVGGTPIELIQLKHNNLRKRANLTNSSPEFWKSIRIWSERITAGQIRGNIHFTLLTTAVVPDSALLRQLVPGHQANIIDLSNSLLEVASTSDNRSLQSAFKAFRSLTTDDRLFLLKSIRILDESSDIIDVRNEIKTRITTPLRFKDQILEHLEGWWFQRVILQINSENPEPLTKQLLDNRIWQIARQYDEDNLPTEFWEEIQIPPEEDTEQMIFVKQLKAIALQKPQINKAIRDFYQAFQQRSRWKRELLLLPQELEAYEEKLVDEWERYKHFQDLALDRENEDEVLQVGRKIFQRIDEARDLPRIRAKVDEPYVIRGSYHILANASEPRVWWHPLFIERLQSLINAADPRSKWEQRPIEVANLMNPAFCALLLRNALKEYQLFRAGGMSWFLVHLVLPIILHKPTRELLPRSKSTKLQPWIQSNPQVLVGFAERSKGLKTITDEAVLFGLQTNVMMNTEQGTFISTQRAFRKAKIFSSELKIDKSEVDEIQTKATFLGRWFAQFPEAIISATLGVSP